MIFHPRLISSLLSPTYFACAISALFNRFRYFTIVRQSVFGSHAVFAMLLNCCFTVGVGNFMLAVVAH